MQSRHISTSTDINRPCWPPTAWHKGLNWEHDRNDEITASHSQRFLNNSRVKSNANTSSSLGVPTSCLWWIMMNAAHRVGKCAYLAFRWDLNPLKVIFATLSGRHRLNLFDASYKHSRQPNIFFPCSSLFLTEPSMAHFAIVGMTVFRTIVSMRPICGGWTDWRSLISIFSWRWQWPIWTVGYICRYTNPPRTTFLDSKTKVGWHVKHSILICLRSPRSTRRFLNRSSDLMEASSTSSSASSFFIASLAYEPQLLSWAMEVDCCWPFRPCRTSMRPMNRPSRYRHFHPPFCTHVCKPLQNPNRNPFCSN